MFLSIHWLGPVIFVHLILVVLNVPSSKKSVLFASLNVQVLRYCMRVWKMEVGAAFCVPPSTTP